MLPGEARGCRWPHRRSRRPMLWSYGYGVLVPGKGLGLAPTGHRGRRLREPANAANKLRYAHPWAYSRRVGVNQCGRFGYRGKEYSITPTRHGFLRNLKWHVRDHGVNTITCTVAVSPG